MTTATQPAIAVRRIGGFKSDLKEVARLVSLGACAGGLSGLLIGGVGGRLAMMLLRFTTEPSINGIESDDGFLMGRFTVGNTLSLLLVCTVLGSIGGLIAIFARPFFPKRFAFIGWPVAAGAIVGATIVKSDGVDFTLLEPAELAIAMFVAIPALGALAIVWLIETWDRWWWKDVRRTIPAAAAGLPSLIVFPVAVAATVVGLAWFAVMRVEKLRRLPQLMAVRGAALAVFAILTGLGLMALAEDISEIL